MLRAVHRASTTKGFRFYSVLPEASSPALNSIPFPENVSPSHHAREPQLLTTSSDNQLKVATLETFQPTSSLSMIFSAGPRFENGAKRGVSHLLKTLSLRGTDKRTPFNVTAYSELYGCQINTALTREHLILNINFLRDELPYAAELLAEATENVRFREHIFAEAKEVAQMETTRALSNVSNVISESLHELAFRKGLGYSLYAPTSNQLDMQDVIDFHRARLSANNVSMVGFGVDAEEVKKYVNTMLSKSHADQSKSGASKYYGGSEIRKYVGSGPSHLAISFQGVSVGDAKGVAAAAVLKELLLQKNNHDSAVEAFSWNYSDNGLFGFSVANSKASQVNKVAKSLLEGMTQLSQSSVSTEALKLAQSRARFAISSKLENRFGLMLQLGQQLQATGSVSGYSQASAEVNNLSVNDAQKLAKKITQSKPCLVAIGDTSQLLHLDELHS